MTAKTESVQYDHPNHTVTVTTISDLDLSGARLLGLSPPEVGVPPSPGGEGTQKQTGSLALPSVDPFPSKGLISVPSSRILDRIPGLLEVSSTEPLWEFRWVLQHCPLELL